MDYLILTLATWRLTSLLVNEDGPGAIFEHLRLAVGIQYDEYSQPVATNRLAQGWLCFWCVSVWMGVVLTALYWALGDTAAWLCLPFALSTGAILIDEVLSYGKS